MDKVKAIEILKPLVESYVDHANITMKEEDDDIADALEMALEALKALDVPDTNVGDMISRRVAIEAIDEWFKKVRSHMSAYEYDSAYTQGEIDAYVTAIDTLKTLPAVNPEPKWIPCSERIPESRVDVLCYTDMGEMVGYYEEHIDAWYGGDDFELIVTAWLPLPKQYKGNKNE